MSVVVHIPTPLRPFVDGHATVELNPGTVSEILHGLTGTYGELAHHLYKDDGSLRSFVNVFVNDRDVRDLDREDTAVADGDEITIVPSIAGGARGLSRGGGVGRQGCLSS